MKLQNMTDFVLEQRMTSEEISSSRFSQIQNYIATYYDKVFAYANFLKQPLTLGMFVSCDEDGGVLREPTEFNPIYWSEEYKKSKEKVLFEGFQIEQSDESGEDIVCNYTVDNFPFNFSAWSILNTDETIEDMLNDGHNYPFELTESAIKQIGIEQTAS